MDIEKPGGIDGTPSGGGTEFERGSSVGRYLILGLLGKGGMGEVYAAYDPELDRKIALKLLRANTTAGGDPSEGRARLLREAQAIARLSDPNVVVVFDVGMFVDRVFLAMEFVDGTTLGYWSQAKPRTWTEVIRVFKAAGRGLASAHKAGMVHRDFKPDNVMIGHDGQIRVMDFGLARTIEADKKLPGERPRTGTTPTKPVDAEARGTAPERPSASTAGEPTAALRANGSAASSPQSSLLPGTDASTVAVAGPSALLNDANHPTRDLARLTGALRTENPASALNSPLTESGAMMGTPAYMAPEQFEGGAVDARTDQFSFCVAVYEALYGERPFGGRSIHELTANVMTGRVREAPPNARVPKWLRRVLLRGLRKDRTERHASMEALLTELDRNPARTRRRWAAGGSVMAVIAILGVGLFRAQRQQRARCLGADAKLAGIWELPSKDGKAGLSPRKEAIRRAFMATGKRYAGDSFAVVAKALDGYVTDWNNMHRDSCEATNLRGEQSAEVLDLRTSCLHDRFSELRALTNVFSEADGDVVGKAVGATQSLRPIEQCGDIAVLRAVIRPPDDKTVRRAVSDVRLRLADVKALASAGRYKRATEGIAPALEAARKTKYEPVIAEALLQLAELQSSGGDLPKSQKTYEDAVWAAQSSRHDEVALEASAQLIWATGYQRKYEEGERWARYASSLLRRLGPGHDVVAGWRANNLGTLYERQGRFEEALQSDLEAVALKEKALGSEHFDVAISHDNVALALFRLGRIQEAIDRNQRAVDMLRRAVGPEHPEVGIRLVNGAEFKNAAGKHSEARAMAQQGRAILENELDPSQPLIAYALTAIGWSFVDGGQPAAAIPYLERALQIRENNDPQSDLLGETRFAMARALWDSKHISERALQLAERARMDYQQVPSAKKQLADVDRWIEARHARLSMR